MKNATIEDVKKAQETGKLEEHVMYNCLGVKVHGKRVNSFLSRSIYGVREDNVIAESADGELVMVLVWDISPITKGPSQPPKKPRRKPVKGTKPEALIPMSADIKLKVGDKVVLSNGVRAKIDQVDCSEIPYAIGATKPRCVAYSWYTPDGYVHSSRSHNIAYIIRPWQEPNKLSKDVIPPGGYKAGTSMVFTADQREKCQAQKDFEAGLWMPFVATDEDVAPSWVCGEQIQVLMQGSYEVSNGYSAGEDYCWRKCNKGTIVAYRKAKE